MFQALLRFAPFYPILPFCLLSGHYETVGHLGSHDGLPMFTFTSANVDEHPVNAPSAGYLRTIARGLKESHGWTGSAIGRYLARFPGAAGTWTDRDIEGLAA